MTQKILCIALKQIGDVLMTTPAVRHLKEKFPHSEIHFLTQPPADQIFRYNPYVNKLIKMPAKPSFKEGLELLKRLRREQYDIVFDFLGLPKTAVIAKLTGAQKRVGFNLRGRSLFYSDALSAPSEMHYSAQQRSSLLSAIGITENKAKLDFYISDKEREVAARILESVGVVTSKPLITVSPVSRREYKVWPEEKFAQVCDHLAEVHSAQILFIWGPGEYHFVKKVKDLMKRSSLPKYEVPSLPETVALFEKADLHIGNDNGPMHFAIAAGIPTVAVFGKPLSRNWTPPNSTCHLAAEFDPGCKMNCIYPKCKLECLHGVTAETVIEMAVNLLKTED